MPKYVTVKVKIPQDLYAALLMYSKREGLDPAVVLGAGVAKGLEVLKDDCAVRQN